MHVANFFSSLHHLCLTGKMGTIFSSVRHSQLFSILFVFCFVFLDCLELCFACTIRLFGIWLSMIYNSFNILLYFVPQQIFRSMFFSFVRQCSVHDVRCSGWKIKFCLFWVVFFFFLFDVFFPLFCSCNEWQTIRILIFMHTHSRILRDHSWRNEKWKLLQM